jgi:hypothetical protein
MGYRRSFPRERWYLPTGETVPDYKDFPINDLAKTAQRALDEGADFYMKFTCAYCGSRQTIDTPNQLFTQGKCEECKSVTDMAKTGGNLLIVKDLRAKR